MATTYVILVQSASDPSSYKEIGAQDGASDLTAIKTFLERSGGTYGEGKYRAVPKRSWSKEPHELKSKVSWV